MFFFKRECIYLLTILFLGSFCILLGVILLILNADFKPGAMTLSGIGVKIIMAGYPLLVCLRLLMRWRKGAAKR